MARPRNIYTRDLIGDFLEGKSDKLATRQTQIGYRSTLSQFAKAMGARPIHKITVHHIADWCKGVDAPNSQLARRSRVTTFFNWATREGYVHDNPCALIKEYVSPARRKVRAATWLTDSEATRLLEEHPDTPMGRRDRLAVACALYTGLRSNEILSLSWHEVRDQTKKEMWLAEEGKPVPQRGAVHLDRREIRFVGKGNKLGAVAIIGQLADEMKRWEEWSCREMQPKAPLVCAIHHSMRRGGDASLDDTESWIDFDQALKYDGLRQAVHRAGARIGHPSLAPHDLRRSLAGILQRRGMPVEQIADVLRHENVATTMAYLEDNPRATIEALEGFVL